MGTLANPGDPDEMLDKIDLQRKKYNIFGKF